MADRWFYAHGGDRLGPFTPIEFRALADAGTLLTTDTVWKNDRLDGVLASRVRHLFVIPETAPEPPPAPPVPPPPPMVEPVKRIKRAIAVSGAVLVGQDGRVVRFRKKCIVCRHEDASWGTLTIVPGPMKASFFCPTCRKSREVLLRGSQS